jgi:hypothetical protein
MNVETRRVGFSFILHPSSFLLFFCGVAKLVRHRTVNAAMRRFESFRHSQIIADCQLPISDWPRDKGRRLIKVNRQSEIGNRQCR